jgi:F-type H+-transporting ATPase subunit delta
MALTRSSARRYAEAAFEIAVRDDSLEAWRTALAVADERLAAPGAMRLLSNPAIPASARIEVLGRLLGDDVTGAPRNLVALLVRRGRIESLPAVRSQFSRLHHRHEGILEATVTSAAELSPAEVEAIRERLVALTGERLELHQQVDATLLGGVTVRIGDRLIDGSVRGRLERLRSDLTTIAT